MDNEDFIRKLAEFMRQYQNHTLKTRYCQRCEEPRLSNHFELDAPVCTPCLETMPEQELRWLAYEYKDK